jgi:hypothetical protein
MSAFVEPIMTRISSSSEFQPGFSAALFDASAAVPAFVRAPTSPRAESGFAVYRNNVVAGLIKAVGQRFPVVRRLAGHDSFDAVAHRYVVTRPPRSPVLIDYGEEFPVFVRGLGSEAMFEYLGDVALLEWLRGRAYHAADATPLPRQAFAALSGRLDRIRVQLHPSVFLMRSRFPIVTIWESGLEDAGRAVMIERWCPECALVARPFLDVRVWRLPPSTCAFVDALCRSAPLAEATEAGFAVEPGFDLAGALALLIQSNVVVALEEPALV